MKERFDIVVGGIEDGMLTLLRESMDYVREFASYGGELDADQLRRALGEIAPRLPLVLVAYGDGMDSESPATAALPDAARVFRHDCTFSVIVCSGDARGETARRRGRTGQPGVYRMIADVKSVLDGARFHEMIEDQSVLLNIEPLRPAGVQYLARLPDLTAYAIHYDTYFKYALSVRERVLSPVNELVFTVENEYPKAPADNLPGVVLR